MTAARNVELDPCRRWGTESAARPDRSRRVLVCDAIQSQAIHRMRAGGLQVDERLGLSPADFEAVIGDYDAVVVRSTMLGARQIAAARRLRLIVRGGVGTDNIDVEAAASREIPVLNTPGASTASVAELALGLMLALARHIALADASLKSGRWSKKELSDGIELEGKILGIVGVGRIGGALGRRASALGMMVLGTDKQRDPVGHFLGIEMVPLEELLLRADFISAHIPAHAERRAALGADEIARMKDGVMLINCARGGVVDEVALLAALESGKVRGAALDVFAEEPPRDLQLARHPRVVCTPHLGASTCEAQDRIGMEIAEILLARL
ncbi:MAG TPA: NAD(P)-dependent oxidoreductase [Planctomycetota bacterium]